MKLIYFCCCMTFLVITNAENSEKKTEQRDVNDAESVDYGSLPKIPVFVIPNTPPGADGKIPVAFIANAYAAQPYSNAAFKRPQKYGFYAPYKTPKVTPIHEPQSEGSYVALTESQAAYQPSADIYQRPEYDPTSAYKAAAIAAAAAAANSVTPTPSPTAGYIKYDPSQTKSLLAKQANIPNGNYAPVYATYPPPPPPPSLTVGENGVPVPQTKKYTTYDAENNLQIQYVIKYVPVPYTVPAANAGEHYAPQPAADTAYITPKPYSYKDVVKKPTHSVAQPVQSAAAAAAAAAAESYASSTENYVEYAKYAEAYATPSSGEDASSQYSPLLKSAYAHQPQQTAYNNKYYDKSAYSKKYAPTSYVLASIGKSAATHYASSIRHDTVDHHHENAGYATKLAPVPLTVDKYTTQDEAKPYSDSEYVPPASRLYAISPSELKYKSALEPEAPESVHHLFNLEYSSPFHYQKKDVSASESSISSNKDVAETSAKKSN